MSNTHQPDETRKQIAQRVLRTAYEYTEWGDDLGRQLAYLAMAILEGDVDGLDLTDNDAAPTLRLLTEMFESDDVVWDFIERPTPEEESVYHYVTHVRLLLSNTRIDRILHHVGPTIAWSGAWTDWMITYPPGQFVNERMVLAQVGYLQELLETTDERRVLKFEIVEIKRAEGAP